MKILVVAGEASGDLHGARLISEIKRLKSNIEFFGVGGEHIKAECDELLFDCSNLAVVGIIEVLTQIRSIRCCFRILKEFIKTQRPDLLILIDYPDFNLMLAKVAKKQGIRVIYYISPQVWAWRKGRVKLISRWVDKVLVIFPFEASFYKEALIDAEFVGHPLLDYVRPEVSQESFKVKFGIHGGERIIALLPGSRKGEVTRLLPVMLDGAKRLGIERPGPWRFVLILASTIDRKMIDPLIEKLGKDLSITIVQAYTYEALKASELAFVASGTATLEAAIIGTPMVLVYKLSLLTYIIARIMINITAVGLVNIVAEEKIVPEFIQFDATGKNLADAAVRILDDPAMKQRMIQGMAKVRKALGEPGAASRAANSVMRFLETQRV
ncbi:lipid-A-disaccharide synthase [bacterium]|nr:lipid-A-disaccharide synthase [bacterium]